MDVILLERVQNLGDLGDAVKVKPGYARNFLIPHGKAVTATPANIAEFEARRAELEKKQADALGAARATADAVDGVAVTVARKVGEEGKLFGSVSAQDIVEALAAVGTTVERNAVRLPEGPLRQVGEHQVAIHFHTEIDAHVTVNVVPEE